MNKGRPQRAPVRLMAAVGHSQSVSEATGRTQFDNVGPAFLAGDAPAHVSGQRIDAPLTDPGPCKDLPAATPFGTRNAIERETDTSKLEPLYDRGRFPDG
jgi:hypothetical protein